ncbi:MAG: NUDIX domain-containing protein [Lachnospiraceae bacterium]|nr:NUDIX domain-containing protein [Lachnospiraceae bacterium]
MASDCTVAIDNGYINIRVGAIIMKGNKFLMVGNQKDEYLYSVGGRIQFGESAEEAVVREVFEETGVRLEVDRLGFVHENFFYGDYGKKEDRLIYEISFFFYMKTPDDFEPVCDSFTDDESKERLIWVDEKSDITYYPTFFREELRNPSSSVKHIVTDNRK